MKTRANDVWVDEANGTRVIGDSVARRDDINQATRVNLEVTLYPRQLSKWKTLLQNLVNEHFW